MSGATKIEWTDATWNPVTGCTKISPGCKNCYAERIFHRPYPDRAFTDVRTHHERLDWPLRWKGSPQAKREGRPSKIFVVSMGDPFHEFVPRGYIDQIFTRMACRDGFIFQLLTKRTPNICFYLTDGRGMYARRRIQDQLELTGKPHTAATLIDRWPLSNVWIGFSAENQETFDQRWADVELLAKSGWTTWASLEPLLGPIVLPKHFLNLAKWVVAGGESGPNARPSHPDWFRSVRDQCQAAGVPFFFKQWGKWKDGSDVGKRLCVYNDGRSCEFTQEAIRAEEKLSGIPHIECNPVVITSVGKKRAGRLLDGREWNEFPETGSANAKPKNEG